MEDEALSRHCVRYLLLNTMRGDGRGHIMKDSDSV